MPDRKIKVYARAVNGYLLVTVKSDHGRKQVLSSCNAEEEDLCLIFWGDEQLKHVEDHLSISTKEKRLMIRGEEFIKHADITTINNWVLNQKQIRLRREESLLFTQKVLDDLHKLFLRERRESNSIANRVNSGIIPYMDGSTLLWLNVILSAKKDFLKGHNDPRRIDEWETLLPADLLDGLGGVKRGNEEAWIYITARDFLFDDNYFIDLGDPSEGKDRSVNCDDLLDNLIENCNSKQTDSTFVDPSIKHMRSSLSKMSGDPKLINLYYKEK